MDRYACAAIIVAAAMNDDDEASKHRRSKWSEDWLLKRDSLGSFNTLHQEMKLDRSLFRSYIGKPPETFDIILARIGPKIQKSTPRFHLAFDWKQLSCI